MLVLVLSARSVLVYLFRVSLPWPCNVSPLWPCLCCGGGGEGEGVSVGDKVCLCVCVEGMWGVLVCVCERVLRSSSKDLFRCFVLVFA